MTSIQKWIVRKPPGHKFNLQAPSFEIPPFSLRASSNIFHPIDRYETSMPLPRSVLPAPRGPTGMGWVLLRVSHSHLTMSLESPREKTSGLVSGRPGGSGGGERRGWGASWVKSIVGEEHRGWGASWVRRVGVRRVGGWGALGEGWRDSGGSLRDLSWRYLNQVKPPHTWATKHQPRHTPNPTNWANHVQGEKIKREGGGGGAKRQCSPSTGWETGFL